MWSNLDGSAGAVPGDVDVAYFRAQVADVRRRQEAGELPADLDPACLLLALFGASSAPVTLPKIAAAICDDDVESEAFAHRYAEELAKLVRHLGG